MKIKEIKVFISKHTINTRHNIMLEIMKHLTPTLGKRYIDIRGIISKTPRPTITILKKKYGNTGLVGAEIGVRRGDNAQNILEELNIEKLYLIDIWDLIPTDKTEEGHSLRHRDHINLQECYEFSFKRNYHSAKDNYNYILNKFKDNKKIEIIKDFSNVAVEQFNDNSLDFVYIDANHSYKKVLEDISIWAKKVKTNGVIGGHDTHLVDVLQAVIDYSIKHGQHLIIEHPDWYFIKHNKGNELKKGSE